MFRVPGEKWMHAALVAGAVSGAVPEVGCATATGGKNEMILPSETHAKPNYAGVQEFLDKKIYGGRKAELSWLSNGNKGEYFLSQESVYRSERGDEFEKGYVSARDIPYGYGTEIACSTAEEADDILRKFDTQITEVFSPKESGRYRAALIEAAKLAMKDKNVARAIMEFFEKGGELLAAPPGGSKYDPEICAIGYEEDIHEMAEVIAHEMMHAVLHERGVYKEDDGVDRQHDVITPLDQRMNLIHDVARGRFTLRDIWEKKSVGRGLRHYGNPHKLAEIAKLLETNESEARDYIMSGKFYDEVFTSAKDSSVWVNTLPRLERTAKDYTREPAIQVDEESFSESVEPEVTVLDSVVIIKCADYTALDDAAVDRAVELVPESSRPKARELIDNLRKDRNYERLPERLSTFELQDIVHIEQVNSLLLENALKLGFFHAEKSGSTLVDVLANDPQYRFDFSKFKNLFLSYLDREDETPPVQLAASIFDQVTSK